MEDQILDSEFSELKRKPLNLAVLAITIIGIGGLIGATTNIINGKVSPNFFQRIMGWDFNGIWIAAIFQGVFEGLIYGIIFSFIYTIGFATITKMKADWKFAKAQSRRFVFVIYICWIIGGIIAIMLAFIFFDDYNNLVPIIPQETLPRIGFAWVAGSIWGGMIGGVITVIWGLIKTKKEWKKETQ